MRRVEIRDLLGATALGLALAAAAAAWGGAEADHPLNAPPMADAAAGGPPQSFATIFQKVSPAVVSIEITGRASPDEVAMLEGEGGPGSQAIPFPFDFGQGDRNGQGSRRGQPSRPDGQELPKIHAAGSGFFVSAGGYIVTNNHVVKDAQTITVRTSDKRILQARLIGRDPATDLAVIKVEGQGYPFVSFEDSAKPRVGDWVVAIGNPFGLGGTATAGIVSALGRENIAESSLIDYMQIDAPINRGNSGGPTFDVYGRVVGVNTAIFSPSGGSVGIGFDIPADVAQSITRQLITSGKVDHGYIGATIQQITADLSESLGLRSTDGALVASLQNGGPAERGGLKVGDVVETVNGRKVSSASDMTRRVAFARPGDTLRLTVLRGGREASLDLRAGLRPSEEVLASNASGEDSAPDGAVGPSRATEPSILGMRLATLDDALRERFNLGEHDRGVVVESVGQGSDAADKGLKPGDVIVKAGERASSAPGDVGAAVADARREKRKDVVVLLRRDGRNLFVPLEVGEPPRG